MDAAGRVGADQHPAPGPGPWPVRRQLLERAAAPGDAIGGSVRPGPPGPQHHRQRLTRALAAVVGERPQRMETVTRLNVGAAPCLLECAVSKVASIAIGLSASIPA